jgi:hypothetical protein
MGARREHIPRRSIPYWSVMGQWVRLGDFILANIEPILVDWEAFARTIAPGAKMEALALRDHAEDILRATAHDMQAAQTPTQRSEKSRGHEHGSVASLRLNGASKVHAVGRVESGST